MRIICLSLLGVMAIAPYATAEMPSLPAVAAVVEDLCQRFESTVVEEAFEGKIDGEAKAVLFKKFLGGEVAVDGKYSVKQKKIVGILEQSIPDQMTMMDCTKTMMQLMMEERRQIREQQRQERLERKAALIEQKQACESSYTCESRINQYACQCNAAQEARGNGWNPTAIKQQCRMDCMVDKRRKINTECWQGRRSTGVSHCKKTAAALSSLL